MKKRYSYITYISLLINLLLLVWYFVPKSRYISSDSGYAYGSENSFSAGGFVNPINFEASKKMYEAYIIYGVTDRNNKISYFYTDFIGNRGGLANTSLQKLLVKRNNDEELVLYDDIYEFTINKKTSNIVGKDKDGHIFTLGFHRYIGF